MDRKTGHGIGSAPIWCGVILTGTQVQKKNFVSSQLVKRGGRREKREAAKSQKELVSTDI